MFADELDDSLWRLDLFEASIGVVNLSTRVKEDEWLVNNRLGVERLLSQRRRVG